MSNTIKKLKRCLKRVSLLIGSAVFFSGCATSPAAKSVERPPNVILIMADDMGYECLAANGSETYKTPRLDKLARQGMRFTHCFSQPICTPTRVPLIVRWPGKITAGTVNKDLIDFSDMLPTIADVTGADVPEDWPIDGRSFAPQLQGMAGNPRKWTYCWYFRNGKPVKTDKHMAGEFARTHDYKLYADGRFYHLPTDELEQDPLDASILNERGRQTKAMLRSVIDEHTRPGFYPEN